MENNMIINSKFFKENKELKLEYSYAVNKIQLPSTIKKFSLIEDESVKRIQYFIEDSKIDSLIDYLNKSKKTKKNKSFDTGYCKPILSINRYNKDTGKYE